MASVDTLRCYEGAVAIVTGGARGIGQALCEALTDRGAEVVLADLDVELAEQTATAIREAGGKVTVAKLDVRDAKAFRELIQATVDRCQRLDFLFNNAGICLFGDVQVHQIEDWDRIIDINLRGAVHGIHAAYNVMIRQGFGHVVNTSSMAGLLPVPWMTSYTATKFAIVGLSEALRVEAAKVGVRVTVLCPGVVRTPALQDGGKFGGFLEPVGESERERIWRGTCPISAEKFAAHALRAVARNRPMVVVPFLSRFFWRLSRYYVGFGRYLMRPNLRRSETRNLNGLSSMLTPNLSRNGRCP